MSLESLDLSWAPDLEKIVLGLLLQIPRGALTTYKDIAVAIGDKRAARGVGTIMAGNKYPDRFPCWRVVHTSGKVGKYSGPGGKEEKISKIEADGIEVEDGTIRNFEQVRFRGFSSTHPLEKARKIQKKVKDLATARRLEDDPVSLAGVDLSYSDRQTVAAYVEVGRDKREPVYSRSFSGGRVKFPYIPGYLAFREIPVLLDLIEKVKRERGLAEILFVDGNGILHPRGAGLAVHLGIILEHPTVGVAKTLLCGDVDLEGMEVNESREIIESGRVIGVALKTYSRANPIFLSIGHRTDLDQATEVAIDASRYKLPEPVRLAHKLAKKRATESRTPPQGTGLVKKQL